MGIRQRVSHVLLISRHRLPSLLLAWALAGLVVRLTIRDRWPVLAVLFYMTPLIVSAVISGIAALLWLLRRRWWFAGMAGTLMLVSAAWWHLTAYAHHSISPGSTGERIVFWNTCRGGGGWDGVANQLRGFDADLIGLVEAGSHDAARERFWRGRFPECQVSGPKAGMVLIARGAIVARGSGDLGGGGKYGHYEVRLAGRTLDVLLVDIKSNPLRSRCEALTRLVQLVDQLADRPLVVMGDFNTPIDSVFVAPLADRLANAFQTAGDGYHVTWPVPVPVMSLDQVWTSPSILLRSCELRWTWRSDHRPVVVTLAR